MTNQTIYAEETDTMSTLLQNELGLPGETQSTLDPRNPVSTVTIDAALADLDPTDDLEPGEFPADALPPMIRTLGENLAEVYQVDPAIVWMASLATLSGAIGKSVTIEGGVNGRTTPCNLYMIAGAPSGYGKGGVSKICNPLLTASKRILEQHSRAELLAEKTQLETRQKKLLKSDSTEDPIKEALEETIDRLEEIDGLLTYPPTYHVGEITGATLEEALHRNDDQIFSFSPEAGEVIAIALGKYAGSRRGDLNLLLAGYSWDEIATARIGRGFKDITPCLSLFWMGQPSLIHELYASPAVLERGLAGRVLSFIVQHDEIPFDDGEERHIDKGLYAAWEACIDQTLEHRDDPRTLNVLPEAKERFTEWHNYAVELRRREFLDIEGALSRWRENAIRIAGVLAVASGAEEITEEIAENATATDGRRMRVDHFDLEVAQGIYDIKVNSGSSIFLMKNRDGLKFPDTDRVIPSIDPKDAHALTGMGKRFVVWASAAQGCMIAPELIALKDDEGVTLYVQKEHPGLSPAVMKNDETLFLLMPYRVTEEWGRQLEQIQMARAA